MPCLTIFNNGPPRHHPNVASTTINTIMDYNTTDQRQHDCESNSGSPPLEMEMRLSDFSIEHILHRAGQHIHADYRRPMDFYPMHSPLRQTTIIPTTMDTSTLSWLQYSRYHPPRIQKSQSKSGLNNVPVRRTPGRLPRVPFSAAQLSALEDAYRRSTYLSSEDANRLAERLDLTSTRVKIWFQNRRARERRERRDQNHTMATVVAGSAADTTVSLGGSGTMSCNVWTARPMSTVTE